METQIHQTPPLSFMAQKCGWPRLAWLIALSARRMELDFAPWKSWVGLLALLARRRIRLNLITPPNQNRSNNGQLRLRDRLCVLTRDYSLDPTLVKAYAAGFCGTSTLREANRELVESFISHLSKSAQENRDALTCKLSSCAQPAEGKS